MNCAENYGYFSNAVVLTFISNIILSFGSILQETDIDEANVERMKGEIKDVLSNGEMQVLQKLEFIDTVQRLGLQHHFDAEIKRALRSIHESCRSGGDDWVSEDDLYATALMFRLLRQHGYLVRQGKII